MLLYAVENVTVNLSPDKTVSLCHSPNIFLAKKHKGIALCTSGS